MNATRNFLCISLLLLGFLPTSSALAEKADREKPVHLEADRVSVDDVKKVHIFDGNVTLIQGTLIIRADKMVVTQDADGFQKGVAYGKPARFKQKREGRDEYVEGEGLRIEHDARTEKTEFFEKAYVISGQDEVKGNYIIYDALTEQYMATMAGQKPVSNTPPARVKVIIQPKNKTQDDTSEKKGPNEPLKLKSATQPTPREE